MVMYHPIKFGCKNISSLADMVETVISDKMSPHCDPELEDSKALFSLHNHTRFGDKMFCGSEDVVETVISD